MQNGEDGLAQAITLRALLQRDGCLTLPGVFDGISARLAASIGFEDPFQFSHTFKNVFGVSPDLFRRIDRPLMTRDLTVPTRSE